MTKFEYLDNTFDFHYKVGDFVDSYYTEPENGKIIEIAKLPYALLRIIKVDEVDEIREVAIVRGTSLVETLPDGSLKCPIMIIKGYGYMDLATENGVHRSKCLIPASEENVKLIMTDKVARPSGG